MKMKKLGSIVAAAFLMFASYVPLSFAGNTNSNMGQKSSHYAWGGGGGEGGDRLVNMNQKRYAWGGGEGGEGGERLANMNQNKRYAWGGGEGGEGGERLVNMSQNKGQSSSSSTDKYVQTSGSSSYPVPEKEHNKLYKRLEPMPGQNQSNTANLPKKGSGTSK